MDSFLRNLWKWKCGLPESESIVPRLEYKSLKETEWSARFEQLMKNRLVIGAYRYGLLNDSKKPQFDRIEAVIKRAVRFKETGNKEYLVDIANLCLLEFEESKHPKAHFEAIDDEEHLRRVK